MAEQATDKEIAERIKYTNDRIRELIFQGRTLEEAKLVTLNEIDPDFYTRDPFMVRRLRDKERRARERKAHKLQMLGATQCQPDSSSTTHSSSLAS